MSLPIIGGLIELGAQWLGNRKAKSQAKADAEIKRIEGDQDYNTQSQIAEGWKDEYLTVVISAPFISMFIGTVFQVDGMAQRTDEFLMAMANAPEWYQYSFMGVIVASFGLKGWKMFKG